MDSYTRNELTAAIGEDLDYVEGYAERGAISGRSTMPDPLQMPGASRFHTAWRAEQNLVWVPRAIADRVSVSGKR